MVFIKISANQSIRAENIRLVSYCDSNHCYVELNDGSTHTVDMSEHDFCQHVERRESERRIAEGLLVHRPEGFFSSGEAFLRCLKAAGEAVSKLFPFVLLFIFYGCFPELENGEPLPSSQHVTIETVYAWESVVGRVTEDCWWYVRGLPVYELSEENFSEVVACQREGYVKGCYLSDSEYIIILSTMSRGEKVDTIAHELIHGLSDCELGDPDVGHSNLLLWIDHGDKTVEAIVWSNL